MFIHRDKEGKIGIWSDYASYLHGIRRFDEVAPAEYATLVPIVESNGRVCPVCRGRQLQRYADTLRGVKDYTKHPDVTMAPVDLPPFSKIIHLITCNCGGVNIWRVKLGGKTVCFKLEKIKTTANRIAEIHDEMELRATAPAATGNAARGFRNALDDVTIRAEPPQRPSRIRGTNRAVLFNPTVAPWAQQTVQAAGAVGAGRIGNPWGDAPDTTAAPAPRAELTDAGNNFARLRATLAGMQATLTPPQPRIVGPITNEEELDQIFEEHFRHERHDEPEGD